MNAMKYATQAPNTVIRIRPNARERLNRIAKDAGWKIAEAIDRAVDALEKSRRRRAS